jgi:hypothetical protein
MFIMNIRTAWNDYFPSNPSYNLNSQTYNSRQTHSSTGVHISNCLFASITSSDHGGALYSTSTYFLVESTSFFLCKTSNGHAGAIYFSNSNGQCVLYAICGYDCYTTGSKYSISFAYTRVYNSVSSKNYVNYSSISRSVNLNIWYTLELDYGNIRCPSVNMSMNKYYGRSFYCYPYTDSYSVTCSLTYSSFTDNHATTYSCLFLWQTGANFEIKSCNIIRNTQGTLGSEGTIATIGNLFVDDSCILENKATNTFYQGNSNYRIIISNNTVDSTSNNGYLVMRNTVTKSFIHALNHMSTRNCHSEYDFAGTLTAFIQSPSSKNQKHCYTGEGLFIQLSQVNFVSLISVFLFNFIHQSASINFWY